VFTFHQGCKPDGASFEERGANLLDQLARYAASPVCGCHGEPIDITAPSVPSTDNGTDDPSADCRNQEQRIGRAYQTGQSRFGIGNTRRSDVNFAPKAQHG
jgi:hypothetical protein